MDINNITLEHDRPMMPGNEYVSPGGTPIYQPPELIENKGISRASTDRNKVLPFAQDSFALGVTLYRMNHKMNFPPFYYENERGMKTSVNPRKLATVQNELRATGDSIDAVTAELLDVLPEKRVLPGPGVMIANTSPKLTSRKETMADADKPLPGVVRRNMTDVKCPIDPADKTAPFKR